MSRIAIIEDDNNLNDHLKGLVESISDTTISQYFDRITAEKAIQQLWNLSDWQQGTAIAMALYGTAFGAAFGNIPANKIGRKKSLIWIGVIFLISSVGAALAQDVYTFMFFRFLSGLSIGASSVVAPVYIS